MSAVPHDTVARIVLVVPRAMLRESLAGVLAEAPGVRLVAATGETAQAVDHTIRTAADVVVVHQGTAGRTALEIIAAVRSGTDARVVLLADEEDEALLSGAFEAGASGFLTTASRVEDLVGAIHGALRGELLVPASMLGALLDQVARRPHQEVPDPGLFSALTPREREVLSLLVEGADSREIGEALAISPQTARTHLHKVLKKLGVHSRLQAAVMAVRAGIVPERDPLPGGRERGPRLVLAPPVGAGRS